jgi:hypothetical protein
MMCGRDNPSNEHYGVRELRTYNNTFCLFRQHKSRRTPHYFLYCYQPSKALIHLRTFVQRHAQIPPRSRRLPKAILRQVNRIPRNHGRGQNNRLYIFGGFSRRSRTILLVSTRQTARDVIRSSPRASFRHRTPGPWSTPRG